MEGATVGKGGEMKKLNIIVIAAAIFMIFAITSSAVAYTLGTVTACTGYAPNGTIQYKMDPTGAGSTFNMGDTVYMFVELKNITQNFRMGIELYFNGTKNWESYSTAWNDVGSYGWKYSYYYPSQKITYVGNYIGKIYIDTGDGFNLLTEINFSTPTPTPTPTPTQKVSVIPYLFSQSGWNNRIIVKNLSLDSSAISLIIYNQGDVVFSKNYTITPYGVITIKTNQLNINSEFDFGEIKFTGNAVVESTIYYLCNSIAVSNVNSTSQKKGKKLFIPFNSSSLTNWNLLLITNSGDSQETIRLEPLEINALTSTVIIQGHSSLWILENNELLGMKIACDNTVQAISFSGNNNLDWIEVRYGKVIE